MRINDEVINEILHSAEKASEGLAKWLARLEEPELIIKEVIPEVSHVERLARETVQQQAADPVTAEQL